MVVAVVIVLVAVVVIFIVMSMVVVVVRMSLFAVVMVVGLFRFAAIVVAMGVGISMTVGMILVPGRKEHEDYIRSPGHDPFAFRKTRSHLDRTLLGSSSLYDPFLNCLACRVDECSVFPVHIHNS